MSAHALRLLGDTLVLTLCCARIAEGVALVSPWRVSLYILAAILTVVFSFVERVK